MIEHHDIKALRLCYLTQNNDESIDERESIDDDVKIGWCYGMIS